MRLRSLTSFGMTERYTIKEDEGGGEAAALILLYPKTLESLVIPNEVRNLLQFNRTQMIRNLE